MLHFFAASLTTHLRPLTIMCVAGRRGRQYRRASQACGMWQVCGQQCVPRQCMEICVHTWSLSSYICNNSNSNSPRCKLTRSQALGACPPGRLLIELLQQHRGDQLRFIGTTWPAPCRALCVWFASTRLHRLPDCGLPTVDCGLPRRADCVAAAVWQLLRDVSKQLMFYLIYTASR